MSVPVSNLYSSNPSEASLSSCKRLLQWPWDALWVPFGHFDGSASLRHSTSLGFPHCSGDFRLSDDVQRTSWKAFGSPFECLELRFLNLATALLTPHTYLWHFPSQSNISTRTIFRLVRQPSVLFILFTSDSFLPSCTSKRNPFYIDCASLLFFFNIGLCHVQSCHVMSCHATHHEDVISPPNTQFCYSC